MDLGPLTNGVCSRECANGPSWPCVSIIHLDATLNLWDKFDGIAVV